MFVQIIFLEFIMHPHKTHFMVARQKTNGKKTHISRMMEQRANENQQNKKKIMKE